MPAIYDWSQAVLKRLKEWKSHKKLYFLSTIHFVLVNGFLGCRNEEATAKVNIVKKISSLKKKILS